MSRYRNDWGWDDEGSDGELGTNYPELENYTSPPDARVIKRPQSVSKRGGFGSEWWGKQWVAVLNELAGEGRLDRGRSYARNGSVKLMEISRGIAFARVQGHRAEPYKTAVKLNEYTDEEWNIVFERLGSQLIYTAKLLAGEMPSDIEILLRDAGVSLFPRSLDDIKFRCSCPDWGDPCKHAAAIYYLLAEQIDADPFVLFHLRGRTREQLLAALRAERGGHREQEDKLTIENFWTGAQPLPALHPPITSESPFIFTESGDPPLSSAETVTLRAIYRQIADYARTQLGETADPTDTQD
ncbi:MAG: SWIM zinc finger family protein [Anaerolineae bacterium]|nr:SWIM zinc finger family protein [Anaerolineae bacterium]